MSTWLTPEQAVVWQELLVDNKTVNRKKHKCWDHYKLYKDPARAEHVVCMLCLAHELASAERDHRNVIPKKFEIKYGATKAVQTLTQHDRHNHLDGEDGKPVVKERKVTAKLKQTVTEVHTKMETAVKSKEKDETR